MPYRSLETPNYGPGLTFKRGQLFHRFAMKRVLNRTLYDTDAAEQIARYAPNTDRSDFHYRIETLYRTSDGQYFLHGEGGAQTKWAERSGKERYPGEDIEVLTDAEAVHWCERRSIDGDVVVEEFGDLIETP